MITVQGAIEKSPTLLSQYRKNYQLDITKIIFHFSGPLIFVSADGHYTYLIQLIPAYNYNHY